MDNDIELRNAIDKSIENVNYFDLGMVLYAMYRYKYVVTSIKNKTWFHFKDHRWVITELGPYKELSTEVITKYKNELYELNKIRRKNREKIINCEKILSLLIDTTSKEKICKECLYIFFDDDFITKLDKNVHLIPFTNGIYDTNLCILRKGKFDDYLSIYINDQFENINQDTENIIKDFCIFRNIIVTKRKNEFQFLSNKK
jgi:hypothetical protein